MDIRLDTKKRLQCRKNQKKIYFKEALTVFHENGQSTQLKFDSYQQQESTHVFGENDQFSVKATFAEKQDICDYMDISYQVQYLGNVSQKFGLNISAILEGDGEPTWLIPGLFYKNNSQEGNTRKYPCYAATKTNPEEMVSNYWSFRSDRATTPAVFAWNQALSAALAVSEVSTLGQTGIGFGKFEEETRIFLNFPYREEPVTYVGNPKPELPDVTFYEFSPNEVVQLTFRLYIGEADLHQYDPFVRQLYKLDRQHHPLKPWMLPEAATSHAAYGLFTWHYKPDTHILCETAAFDRELNNNVNHLGDRNHMHVGWVSGVPYAYALLKYGREQQCHEYISAGADVIDFIAEGLSPGGFFWASWTEKGWGTGWNPKKNWLQARTLAEATWFMLKAVMLEKEYGVSHPEWEKAISSNLITVVKNQAEDGNFGSYYDCETGDVTEWQGAGGILWIAALCTAAVYFQKDEYKQAALAAGAHYQQFVEDEYIYGAPEDVHFTPTSEDAYNAVVSYIQLYELNREEVWLDMARKAGDWMMTFRWSYNIEFPEHTFLNQYDYRTRGADQASPSNQHLHNYGLFCFPEMMKLYRYTKDTYYLDRTIDNVLCFLQFVARFDGDFNAYRGMVTERFYHTNCFQAKGMMLTLSHAWCVGLVLYACQEVPEYEEFQDLWQIFQLEN